MTIAPASAYVVYLAALIHLGASQISHIYMFNLMCTEDNSFSFFRAVPWSCSQYLLCVSGMSFPGQCPPGQVFRQSSLMCERATSRDFPRCRQTIMRGITSACQIRPDSNVASPISCSQYFRCSGPAQGQDQGHQNGDTNGVTSATLQPVECPYPFLFSEDTGTCQRFDSVACDGKIVPKAPCDYAQYQRLCNSPGCPPCNTRHPSCVGLSNGFQQLLGKPSYYLACYDERTLDVRQCQKGLVFSPPVKACVKS